jgi:PAS domain S-box-containing protein
LNPSVLTDPRIEARMMVRRFLFGTFAVVGALAAALVATNATLPAAARFVLGLGFAGLATLSGMARGWPATRTDAAMVLVSLGAVGLITANAVLNGTGINSSAIGFLAVLTFAIGATVTARLGLLLASISAAVLLWLAWGEHGGWLAGAAAVADIPLSRRLVNQLLLVAVAAVCGQLVARVFIHYLGASRDRELRFQNLLGIAADSYWEMDAHYVITAVWRRQDDQRFVCAPQPLLRPWDQPELAYDDGALAAHQADLDARRRFRDLHVRWRRPDGSVRHELVSGEPRFAPDGAFLGYWGVSRDISDRIASGEALRRSEAMLSHLVSTTPDLITLTELSTGRYVMVNEAFTRITGYRVDEVLGRTSIELGLWGDSSMREAFVARLRGDGVVTALPVEFVGKRGQTISMQVSGATFELEGGHYLVLNCRDVTAAQRTQLAHQAVLENASLGIAFTREQRFVQANPALEKMLGWAPGTLVGQPGVAVWSGDAEYAEVGALIGAPLARGEPVEFVRELTRRDGTVFWCRMLAKAVDPTHPMRGGTIWIIEDITERRRTDQALAKARDDAEAANRAKSAFLANTIHEIRTPLNGLVGLARLVRRTDLDEGRRRQYLEQIGDSAETLSAVISDVLDLSKIEAGKLEVERVPFDLHALLDSLRRVYATLADARGLAFALQVDAAVPAWADGDPVRVRQVLGNFLSNALKFTTRGEVTLRVAPAGADVLRFEVADTGIGIAPEVQARLFHPFTQADESTTRRFGGSGLGLSICRELAGLMQGSVGVHSVAGEGSVFWVELPLPCTPAQPLRADAAASARLRGTRVLMAEDNPVNTTIAVAMLEQWGIEVTEALDGAQAIDAVERAARAGRPFHVVLMDVQMPVMSGYEATRRLREHHDARTLPIIALTAAALTSERERAIAAGMTGFLTKPIDVQRLHDTLLAALDSEG